MYFLSPNLGANQFDDTKRLQVFRDRTLTWVSEWAIRIAKEKDGGVPALMLAVGMIEPIGGVVAPGVIRTAIAAGRKSWSRATFREGWTYVYPALSADADHAYERLRCGLFHQGFTQSGVVLADTKTAVERQGDMLYVNPVHFALTLDGAFRKLCDEIETIPSRGKEFDEYWTLTMGNPVLPPVVQIPYTITSATLAPTPGTVFLADGTNWFDDRTKAK